MEIVYVMDKDIEKARGEIGGEKVLENLFQLRDIEQIDGIIITAISFFEEIKERIREYTEISVVSIENLL